MTTQVPETDAESVARLRKQVQKAAAKALTIDVCEDCFGDHLCYTCDSTGWVAVFTD